MTPADDEIIEAIIMKLPQVTDRAKLLSHFAILRKQAKEGTPDAPRIARWIRETWPTSTVRAKMAQKIAGLIEKGEYK